MKRNTKKGFTLVELVIVIAVIAILSAVLIPTFSSVTKKAKESAALSEASSALTAVLDKENGALDTANYNYYFESDGYYYEFKDSKLNLLNAKPDSIELVDNEATTDVDERTVPAYTKAELNDLSAKLRTNRSAAAADQNSNLGFHHRITFSSPSMISSSYSSSPSGTSSISSSSSETV